MPVINYLAVLAAAVAGWLIGAVWYGVLGNAWMAALGWTAADMTGPDGRRRMPIGPMVRGFAGSDGQGTPPAKLAFYSPPSAAAPARVNPAISLKPLTELLRLNDAGQSALLGDWLNGCYTASSLDDALAARDKLQAGEVIYVQSGHGRHRGAIAGSQRHRPHRRAKHTHLL